LYVGTHNMRMFKVALPRQHRNHLDRPLPRRFSFDSRKTAHRPLAVAKADPMLEVAARASLVSSQAPRAPCAPQGLARSPRIMKQAVLGSDTLAPRHILKPLSRPWSRLGFSEGGKPRRRACAASWHHPRLDAQYGLAKRPLSAQQQMIVSHLGAQLERHTDVWHRRTWLLQRIGIVSCWRICKQR